LVIYCSIYTAL